jgi:hypothetical protein
MIPPSLPTALDFRSQVVCRIISPTGLAVTVLIGITLAFYHGLWLPGLVLIKRDAFRVFLPFKQYTIERLSAGELAQWFPYEGLGRSFIGVTHTGIFHPFTALYFFFPVHDAYRLSTLLSCLLAALGAFTLGRMLHFSRTGALVAGIAFTLSGYVVSMTDNLVYLYSICLLPFFCAAIEKALAGSRPWAVVPAALWATVFLNGDVQTGYYYIFIALAWVLARAPGSYWEAGRRLALAGLLAVLLAGIQLGPSWAAFQASERAHSELFREEIVGWSTHPLRLLTVLAAPIGENVLATDTDGIFSGGLQEKYIGYFWAESLYLGVPVLGLALGGMRQRRDLRVLAWMGGVALLLALGRWGGLYAIVSQWVPLWSAFRYPEKLMGIVSFAIALLAGAGLDAMRTGKSRPTPWFVAAALCLIAGFGLPTEAGTKAALHFGAPSDSALTLMASAGRAYLFSAIAALGIGLVIAGIKSGTLRLAFLLAALVGIVALDLSRANLGTYHTGPVEVATFTPPLAEALRAREGSLSPGRFRLVTLEESQIAIPAQLEQAFGHYAAVIVARRQAIDALHGAELHIESARRYLTGFKADLIAMIKQPVSLQAAARYNVAYYIGSRSRLRDPLVAGGVVAELPDYDLILFRNPVPAKPRAYLSRRPERAASPVDPAALLKRPDFLSGDVDVIETSDAALPGPAAGGSAVIERYAPETVRMRVETPHPAALILLDAFDKGWTATLENGAEIPILRANVLARAVVVPPGVHTVTFRYATPLLKTGAWASLLGCVIGLAIIAFAHRRTQENLGLL